ncbi:hypothetical protein [Acidovorax sp. NCPPB 3576]|uniref:hypothetical protein n=1 Tax=Acidovorax sp. NCPPB 3576 TaxID=2940488 RepID=UPI00234A38EE|nr:hypothetical protein [Acidovorax sp. NCPPB 3576]WCM88132.1 hypothetical protein M5C98_22795 [Acidovorax sp. NCPPB 3576]
MLLQNLSASAADFANTVWPAIQHYPLVGGGKIRPAEGRASRDFKDELDLLAGIDAWQILRQPGALRGLASRVQWAGENHRSFAIRYSRPCGAETEYQKRLMALSARQEGYVFAHLTVQAFLTGEGGSLRAAAVIKTEDLIRAAQFIVTNAKAPRPAFYGRVAQPDGGELLYLKWDYLAHKKVPMAVIDLEKATAPQATA